MDPQTVVRRGYDTLGDRYLRAFTGTGSWPRLKYIHELTSELQPGSPILELGCGPGYPVTQALAERYSVVAVDLSRSQLALARTQAPAAILLQADMTRLQFAPASFDAVVAFYSLTHVPRDRHAQVLRRAEVWLRPGGLLVGTMGTGDIPGAVEDDWLGVPMFFSHFDAATNLDMVKRSGLRLEEASVLKEVEPDGTEVAFLWIIARKISE